MQKQYELSLWRDYPVIDTIREEKVVILASSSMNIPGRAQNIKLKKKYNGELTLTFSIPYKCQNEIGELVVNDLCKRIEVKSKIKLFRDEKWWNRFHEYDNVNGHYVGAWEQGRWYDFIVKIKKEKRSKKKLDYEFECSSLFVDELAHTGYDLEFVSDTDIMSASGIGTAHDLARRVVKGTDWEYVESEVFKDYEEVFDPDTGETVKNPVSTDQIELIEGLDRYGYCYQPSGATGYADSLKEAILKQIKDADDHDFVQDNLINTTSGFKWKRSTVDAAWRDYVYGYEKTNIGVSYAKPLLCQDSGIEKFLNRTEEDDSKGALVGCSNFSSTLLWKDSNNLPIPSTYDNSTGGFYIKLESNQPIFNFAINDVQLNPGEIYAVNCLFIKDGAQSPGSSPVNIKIGDATDVSSLSPLINLEFTSSDEEQPGPIYGFHPVRGRVSKTFYFKVSQTIKNPLISIQSETYNILLKGLYIYPLQPYIEDETIINFISSKTTELSGEFSGTDSKETIGEYHFYRAINQVQLPDNSYSYIFAPMNTVTSTTTSVNEYLCEFNVNGKTYDCTLPQDGYTYTKLTSADANKRRAINVSKSNRFSILTEICKTFYCFMDFVVAHDSTGHILRDSNGKMIKQFTFSSELGMQQFAGFNYGVNLESIERSVDATNLVTKVYVEPIDNQYDGLIAISTSDKNKLHENFIYNFAYYLNRGLIDKYEFLKDYKTLEDNVGALNMESLGRLETISKQMSLADSFKNQIKGYELIMSSYMTEVNDKLKQIGWGTEALEGLWKADRSWGSEEFIFPTLDYTQWNGYSTTSTWNINSIKTEITDDDITIDDYRDVYALSYYINRTIYKGATLSTQTIYDYFTTIFLYQNSYKSIKAKLENQVNGIKTQYNKLKREIDATNALIDQYTAEKNALIAAFENKYKQILIEGTWSSQDYIDATKYYLDATRTMATSCMPKVSYSATVIDLSAAADPYDPTDKTWGEDFVYNVGDTTYIRDKELFGDVVQKAMISEIEASIDDLKPDKITIQNYETRFEDLFQAISAAVTTLTMNENIYSRAEAFTTDGLIDASILNKSLQKNKELVINTVNDTVTQGQDGITIRDMDQSTGQIMRLNSAGVFLSKDNGLNWYTGLTADGMSASLITAGRLDTSKVVIMADGDPRYILDKLGLTAYRDVSIGSGQLDGVKKFVRFDKNGFYMTDRGYLFQEGWENRIGAQETAAKKIKDNSIVSITEDGFYLNGVGKSGSLELSTQEVAFISYSGEGADKSARVKVGYIRNDNGVQVHGIDIYEGAFRMYGVSEEDHTATNAALYFKNDDGKINMYMNGTINIERRLYSGSTDPASESIDGLRIKSIYSGDETYYTQLSLNAKKTNNYDIYSIKCEGQGHNSDNHHSNIIISSNFTSTNPANKSANISSLKLSATSTFIDTTDGNKSKTVSLTLKGGSYSTEQTAAEQVPAGIYIEPEGEIETSLTANIHFPNGFIFTAQTNVGGETKTHHYKLRFLSANTVSDNVVAQNGAVQWYRID